MSVARTYAKALFEVAKDKKLSSAQLEKIEAELDGFISILDQSKDVQSALIGPTLTAAEKAALVGAFSKSLGTSKLVEDFVVLLVRKKRLLVLNEIRESLAEVRLEAEGGIMGRVVSADPLSAEDLATLVGAFEKKLKKKILFRATTDASLLAGMKVTVSGISYDGSLQSKLEKLKETLVLGDTSSH